ncbi:MAG TPA: hypothetical protein VHZ99_00855 [Steroidobacteraceae bacterium]|nr:hypothetical protein [Steroidobacteraceae bacterium]
MLPDCHQSTEPLSGLRTPAFKWCNNIGFWPGGCAWARKAAAHFALWLKASLFAGAFSASLAAIEGGGLRDGTWKYKV